MRLCYVSTLVTPVSHNRLTLLLLARCVLWLRRYVYSIRNRMYDSLAPYIKESDKEKLSATLQVRARGRGRRVGDL